MKSNYKRLGVAYSTRSRYADKTGIRNFIVKTPSKTQAFISQIPQYRGIKEFIYNLYKDNCFPP